MNEATSKLYCLPHFSGDLDDQLQLSPLSSHESKFPAAPEAKPHCGLTDKFSIGTYFDASSILRSNSSCCSSLPDLVVISPRTMCFPFGTNRSGSKPPARSVSYSSK